MKRLIITLFALSFSCGVTLHAQPAPTPKLEFPAASPAATIKQRVGLTDVEINYSQPGVKGRKIFGGLAPYGEVWRTGANAATRLTFSTPVKLNGTAIPAGSYELFTIPQKDEWTVIIHKPMSQWGAYKYDSKNDVARIMVKPVTLPEVVETLSILLTGLRDDSAILSISWDHTRVPVTLEVDTVATLVPQIEALMASDAPKKPYAQAAMFYADHDHDVKKAIAWMDAAIAAQPDSGFYLTYHKALILAKQGDKNGALASAKQSIDLAQKAGGSVTTEYVRLNETLIASLK